MCVPSAAKNHKATAAGKTVLAAAMLMFGLGALSAGCRLMANHVKGRTPQTCAECHVEITRQWASSGHAAAWTDPQFVADTLRRQVKQCLPCHAPQPVLDQAPAEPPRLREADRDCGVDCAACHAAGCAYAGPYRSWGPHHVQQDVTRLPCSTFCGTCHEVENAEYRSFYLPSLAPSQAAEQCADCHMPTGRSRLTQGHVLSLAHPRRTVHDHSFPLWTHEVVRGAVVIGEIELRRDGQQIEVCFTLTNQGAGHRIPTGQFGHREVRVLVELRGEDGAVLASEEQSLLSRDPACLSPGVASPFSLMVNLDDGPRPATVRVLVEKVDRTRSFQYTLATREDPVDRRASR